ncbi:glycosyl hydrolase 53 family protein [Streptomyces sp. L7]
MGTSALTTFLKAGLTAAHDTTPASARCSTSPPAATTASRWWYDNVVADGVDFDIIAQSCYPFWHGARRRRRPTWRISAARYDKPVLIAETAIPVHAGERGRDGNDIMYDPRSSRRATRRPLRARRRGCARWRLNLMVDVPGGEGPRLLLLGGRLDLPQGRRLGPDRPDRPATRGENLALFDFDDRALPGLRTLGRYRS